MYILIIDLWFVTVFEIPVFVTVCNLSINPVLILIVKFTVCLGQSYHSSQL